MKFFRKVIGGILAAAILLSNISAAVYAEGDESGGLTDAQIVSADLDLLTFDLIKQGNKDAEHITDSLYLPTSGDNGSDISWKSNANSLISTDPDAAGNVTRPSAVDGDQAVILTATLTSGSKSDQKTFDLTVIALESMDIPLEELHVRQDYNWLTYTVILKDNVNNATPPDVKTDLSLPTQGESGSNISWTTSDESVIATDGTVTQPSDGDFSYPVTVTAEISNGDYKLEKSFPVHVDCTYPSSDAVNVNAACDDLTIDGILKYNTQDCVLSNLTLPTDGSYDCAISWASSDEPIIATDGTVTQPAYDLTGYRGVTLTATVSKDDEKQTKQFTVRVPCAPSDEDETAAQKDALWLSDDDEMTDILSSNDSAKNVQADLSLPSAGENGSAISWSSSDPSVIGADGTVTPPAGDDGLSVILTATVTNGGAQAKRRIFLWVPSRDETQDELDVDYDYNYMGESSITYGWEATDLNYLKDRTLWLPQDDSGSWNSFFYTQKGCTVSWSSSDPSVFEVVKDESSISGLDGVPHRPSFLEGDQTVTLTATITKGDASREKSFQITVAALGPEGAEAVVLDKEWLTDELILNGNSADDVKITLNLPTCGKYGSGISWQSSDETAVDPKTGKVTRPEQNQENVNVTLTASLSTNNYSSRAAKDQKTFQITVTKKENAYLAVKQDDFSHVGSLQLNGAAKVAQADGKNALQLSGTKDGAGSVFTKNKMHLGGDGSFSTAFAFKINQASADGGLAFTLQAKNNTESGGGYLGTEGITPSVSVGFYVIARSSGQGGTSSSFSNISLKVFRDGNYDSAVGTSYAKTLFYSPFGVTYHTWIEYDGAKKTMEIRVAKDTQRPLEATAVIENVDINSLLQIGEGQSAGEVYAGFTGADDENDILNWSFQSGSDPIDSGVYDYVDASQVVLPGDQSVSQKSIPVEASVSQNDALTAAVGVPVTFTTTYGDLSDSSAVTNSEGKASTELSVQNAGLAQVEAVAAGGATASAAYSFAFSDADSVALDKEWLQTDDEQTKILKGNSDADHILTDLTLPGTGLNGSTITWSSDNTAVKVDNTAGTVTLPTAEQGDQTVTLKAEIGKGSEQSVYSMTVTVKTTDTAYVLADCGVLTDDALRNGNADLQHVTQNLTLPKTGKNGSAIAWTFTNDYFYQGLQVARMIDPDGKVTRPPFTAGEKTVTLTATLTLGSAAATKNFEVTVLAVPATDQEAVDADADALMEESILNGNASADSVMKTLSLPTAGENGSTITWESSNSLYLAADGTVSRPAYSTGDQSVTLTAALTKGEASTQKKFSLTIKRQNATEEELLFEGCDWLDESRTLGADNLSQYAVMSGLSLPDETANGLSITWKSGSPDFISDDGTVTRPIAGAENQPVTLTATLSNSSGSMTKKLQYTVLAIPDTTVPSVIGSSLKANQQAAYDTQKITLTFSEAVQLKDQSGITLEGPDAPGFYAMICSDENGVENQLVITLSGQLDPGSHYTLTVPKNAVTDLSGNPTAYDYRNTFLVEKKTVRTIGIISTTPADGTKDYAKTGSFMVTFDSNSLSEGPAFDNVRIVGEDGTEYTAANATFKVLGRVLYLTLPSGTSLNPGYSYQIIVPEGAVQDYYKNTNEAKTIQFSTHYSGSVNVFDVYPLDSMESVDIHQDIFFTVPGGSGLDTSGVTLKDGSGNAVEASVSRFGMEPYDYVVQPVQPLKPNTAYTMVIAKDALTLKVSGGTRFMDSDYTLKFTTGGNSLPIQSVSPEALEQQANVDGEIKIKFSSNIQKVTTTGGIVVDGASGMVVKSSASAEGGTVTVDTDSPLEDVETYTVTLPAGAYESGGKKNDALRFRFITASAIDTDSCTFDMNPSNIQIEDEPISFGTDAIKNELRLYGLTAASYKWSFGDGSVSAEAGPSHSYAAAGRYTVTLTVKDDKEHSYTWTRGVNILSYSSDEIHLSVTPNANTALYLTDEASSVDSKQFTVKLTYGDAGMPLSGKFVQIKLYQNGQFIKNLYWGTTYTGIDAGTMSYKFQYQNYSAGTYELRFVYGTDADNAEVSVPVTIYNKRTSQDLRLEFYDSKTGNSVYYFGNMEFLMDGQKVTAKTWYNSTSDHGVEIPGVPLGSHTLSFVSAEELVNEKFTYSVNDFTVNHTGENNVQYVKAIPLEPGIISVTSKAFDTGGQDGAIVSDSNSQDDTVFIEGVTTPAYTFTVKGNLNGEEGACYILKTSTGRVLFKRYGTNEAQFVFIPAYQLKAGERLLAGMETINGRQSAWVDTKIKVISSPASALGEDNSILYQDGKYEIKNPVTLPTLLGNSASVPDILKYIPGLEGDMGIEDDLEELIGGSWDGGSRIDLTFDLNADFSNSTKSKKSKKSIAMKAVGMDVDVDLNGEFILNYNDSFGEWEVYYQRFTLQGDVTKSYGRAITIPKTSISVASITIKLGVLVGGTFVFQNGNYYPDIILNFEPHAEGDVEVGLDWANITATLKASLPCELDYPGYYFEIDPNASFKVEAEFLWYSTTLYKKTVKTEWDNGKDPVKLLSLSLASGQLASTNLEESSRNYLTRPFEWLSTAVAPKLLLSAAAKAENPSVEELAQNVYPGADVQLIQSGGKLCAVWTDDNPDRSDENRTQLRYSVYEDGAWSAPAWLGADATGDFSPAAAAVGDGGTLIAWQDMKTGMSADTDADTASQNCEISVSKNPLTDSGSFETARLTDDDQFDHSPQIASDGGSALVAWTKSDGLALDGTATKDSLWAAKWTKDGGWSNAEEVADVGYTVISSSLAMHDGTAILLYTADTDNDLSTSTDEELYAVTYDGNSWEKPVQVTDNLLEDINPQVTYTNGGWMIVWNQENQTVYQIGLDGETKTADNLSGVGNKFQLVSTGGDDPQVTLVYYTPGDDGTRGLAEATYDAAAGLWGNEEVLTDGTDGYTGSFSPVYTEDGQLKILYTQADMVTESVDGDEYDSASDKADLELLTDTPEHDLALDADDGLLLSADTPVAGVPETVTVTVGNLGDYAENAAVTLYLGDPENGGKKVAQSESAVVAAHSSAQAEIDWQVSSDFSGACDLYAVVAPADGITDSNESNNTVSRTISTTDLSIIDAKGEYIANNKYQVKSTVQNIGSDTLKNVILNLTDENGRTLASETIDELAPGVTAGFNEIVSADSLTQNSGGNYDVALTAVLPEGIADNDTDDNTDSFELETPFITVDGISPAPNEEQVELQKPISVTFNMKVQQDGGFSGISLKDSSLNPVEITAELQDDTLTVTPKGDMAKGTEYTLTIPADAISDSYGHKMETAYTLVFTTVTSGPAVVFANPGEEMENAPADSDIKLEYNQEIGEGLNFSGISVTDGSSRKIPVSAAISGQWLTLQPSGDLSEATQYTVTVPMGAVKNVSGEVQPEAYSYSFTTESAEEGSLSDLQSLVDTCSSMTQGNYTDASWSAFQKAIQAARAVLEENTPSETEIKAAIQALTAAKNGLSKKSSGSPDRQDSDSGEENKQETASDPSASGQSGHFRSDTTGVYRFSGNSVYYYKITTPDTIVPTAVSSNQQVAAVMFAQKLSDGYLFQVLNLGAGEAVITTRAGDDTTTLFTVEGSDAGVGVLSDTPYQYSVQAGKTYQFKFTLPSGTAAPTFTIGNSAFLRTIQLRKAGNIYYLKILALTRGSAGVYITIPGEQTIRECVVNVN